MMRSVKLRRVAQQKRCQNVEAFQISTKYFLLKKSNWFTFNSLKYSFIFIIKNIKFSFRCNTTYHFNSKYIYQTYTFLPNKLPSVNDEYCLTYNESIILKQSSPLNPLIIGGNKGIVWWIFDGSSFVFRHISRWISAYIKEENVLWTAYSVLITHTHKFVIHTLYARGAESSLCDTARVWKFWKSVTMGTFSESVITEKLWRIAITENKGKQLWLR